VVVTVTDGFALIADPSRRQILDLLLDDERDVSGLVSELGVPQPNVSKHLRVLREAGVVISRIDGARRVYRLSGQPLDDVEAWLRPHRERWSKHFDALQRHLDARRAGNTKEDQP
jgi:DNA-binding transcriptional ArsR family regulator